MVHISCTSYQDRFTAHFAIALTEAQVSFPPRLCENVHQGVYFLRIFLAFLRQGSLEANSSVVIVFFSRSGFPHTDLFKRVVWFCFRKPSNLQQAWPEYHIINPLVTLLEPHLGILTLGRFWTELAVLGPHCHNFGPIFPSTALALGW